MWALGNGGRISDSRLNNFYEVHERIDVKECALSLSHKHDDVTESEGMVAKDGNVVLEG
jgi:hypothetical protein